MQAGRSERRIGVGDGPADRAPVADLDVADGVQGVAQQAVVPRRGFGQLAVGRHRTDRQPAVGQLANALESAQSPDIHELSADPSRILSKGSRLWPPASSLTGPSAPRSP